VSSVPADRFGVGSAVNQTARQVGGSIGIAILVVILGAPATRDEALRHFQQLWFYAASMAALSGAVATLLGPNAAVARSAEAPTGSSASRAAATA
jgi:hypothetical protein